MIFSWGFSIGGPRHCQFSVGAEASCAGVSRGPSSSGAWSDTRRRLRGKRYTGSSMEKMAIQRLPSSGHIRGRRACHVDCIQRFIRSPPVLSERHAAPTPSPQKRADLYQVARPAGRKVEGGFGENKDCVCLEDRLWALPEVSLSSGFPGGEHFLPLTLQQCGLQPEGSSADTRCVLQHMPSLRVRGTYSSHTAIRHVRHGRKPPNMPDSIDPRSSKHRPVFSEANPAKKKRAST